MGALNRKRVANNVHLDLSPKEINLRLLDFTMIWELEILRLIFLKLRHELSTKATALHALVRGSFHQLKFNLLASAIDSKRLAEILPPFHGDMGVNILVFWRLK